MKPTLFIGSSAEALPIANACKEKLKDQFEVSIWNEEQFKVGDSILDTLLTFANLYDFGLFLGTPDDLTQTRTTDHLVQRDNVVFEYGIFAGALGKRRAFALVDDAIKVPSDLDGLYLLKYNSSPGAKEYETLETKLDELVRELVQESQNIRYQLLPSTALAIGYFDGFVKLVANLITYDQSTNIEGEDYMPVKFNIVIPDNLKGDISSKRARLHKTLNLRTFNFERTVERRSIGVDALIESGNSLHIYDLPTTLSGIDRAIAIIYNDRTVNVTTQQRVVEFRELTNFKRVLEGQIEDSDYSDFVNVIWQNDI